MTINRLNLHLFDGDGGAGAAPAAGGTGEGEAAVTPGVLEDGTEVDNRLAARLESQAKRRKARGEQQVQLPSRMQESGEPAAAPAEEPVKSLDDEWTELRKGKFKDQYSRDVQSAIQDRFKNQKDAAAELDKLQPMLRALEKVHGVEEGDVEALSKVILDDDSLYEEAADEMGMTIEGYKSFMQAQAENERLKKQEEMRQEEFEQREHFKNLWNQGEELKKIYPNFDLMEELKNETFFRLTQPNSGLSVSDAFYAIHHSELEPQAMAYGIQRAQSQISKTLQANRQRPSEGAMQGSRGPGNVEIDPRRMTREQRQQLIDRARRGEQIEF